MCKIHFVQNNKISLTETTVMGELSVCVWFPKIDIFICDLII